MLAPQPDLLQGTLDLLILKSLQVGPLHGWAISRRIQQMSSDVLVVNQGSLYPALYRLTAAGRRQLSHEINSWRLFAAAITQVVDAQ